VLADVHNLPFCAFVPPASIAFHTKWRTQPATGRYVRVQNRTAALCASKIKLTSRFSRIARILGQGILLLAHIREGYFPRAKAPGGIYRLERLLEKSISGNSDGACRFYNRHVLILLKSHRGESRWSFPIRVLPRESRQGNRDANNSREENWEALEKGRA